MVAHACGRKFNHNLSLKDFLSVIKPLSQNLDLYKIEFLIKDNDIGVISTKELEAKVKDLRLKILKKLKELQIARENVDQAWDILKYHDDIHFYAEVQRTSALTLVKVEKEFEALIEKFLSLESKLTDHGGIFTKEKVAGSPIIEIIKLHKETETTNMPKKEVTPDDKVEAFLDKKLQRKLEEL
jgi:hypothetical protein